MDLRTLIDVETLAAQLDEVRVVDCRFALADPEAGQRAWRAATIPGAAYAHLDRDLSGPVVRGRTGRHPLPSREVFASTAAAWGIDGSTPVVAFDDMGGAFAARLWWMLRWIGHERAAVLDGGLPAWTGAGHPTAPGVAQARGGDLVARSGRSVTVDANEVLAVLSNPGVAVMDARAASRYRGEQETTDPIAGHIAGAVSVPFAGNLDASGRFLDPQALRARFTAVLGTRGSGDAICYCGSGVTACHDVLAMVHAGLAEPRLYVGSWSEWITDPSRPCARG